MDELIGFLLPLIFVIGGILGLFKKSEDSNENKPVQRTNPSPRPTPTPSGGMDQRAELQQESEPEHKGAKTFQEKMYDKLESIESTSGNTRTKEIQQNASIHDAIKGEHTPRAYKKTSTNRKSMVSVRGQLTKKGLVNSVVMAEVLGQPRATKPYRYGWNQNK
ncbi:hypothetical protein [Radiobacillus sp. PE A8.2]|uniref:hypothetical protein n=1 Tax=Radiobacillus sp. PE A8.2 TaxID=3380349 RepID=UPI0038906AF7